jgi:pyruvate,water dikinase
MEDHCHYIDRVHTCLLRLPALALGERLVYVRALANVDDVFFLTPFEIRRALVATTSDPTNLAETARYRRERFEAARRIDPPMTIGEGVQTSDGLHQSKRFHGGAPPHADGLVITGRGASAGVAQGTARVVRNLDEVDVIRRSNVLVCRTTSIAWIPFLLRAGAIVTDTGGELCHTAIVAREYGIPCVVGTEIATKAIRDRQPVIVDGERGTVTVTSK